MAKSGSKSDEREARLAKALRDNLRRRKAQGRARDAGQEGAGQADPSHDKDKGSS